MSANFEGKGGPCGEHRTVGPHRAWCYACSEWCYPGTWQGCSDCERWEDRVMAVHYALATIERGDHAAASRDFNRGMAYAAMLIRTAIDDAGKA